MGSDRGLMQLHVTALLTHDADGRLLRVNEAGGTPAPRFFLGRTADGNEWRFRHDLAADIVDALNSACVREPVPTSIETAPALEAYYLETLAAAAPIQKVSRGPTFKFPTDLPSADGTMVVTPQHVGVLQEYLGEWVGDVDNCQPVVALLEGEQAVSICASVRITNRAYEAGVETHSAFRRRGHAVSVVARWAAEVRKLGCIPLYSTSWNNLGSREVAAKLDLVPFGVDFHVT